MNGIYGHDYDDDANQVPDDMSLVDQFQARLIDSGGLDSMPKPEPLIDGLLYANSLAWLYGKRGSGKSFIAIDWACCIDAGLPWIGRPVRQGPVLYVIAEGVSGLPGRVRAWEDKARMRTGVFFLPVPAQLINPRHVAALGELAARLGAVLVVLDTQARVAVGLEENSARDMGVLVAAVDRVRDTSGACVLTVHHEPRNGENMRGSTALEGAATTMLRVVRDGPRVDLSNEKQKDAAEADKVTLWMTPQLQSVVIAGQPNSHQREYLTDSQNRIRTALRESFGSDGASASVLLKTSGVPESTFYRALKALVSDGWVTVTGTEKRPRYAVAESPILPHSQSLSLPPTLTPTPITSSIYGGRGSPSESEPGESHTGLGPCARCEKPATWNGEDGAPLCDDCLAEPAGPDELPGFDNGEPPF